LGHQALQHIGRHIAGKLGMDRARMYGGGPDAASAMAPVELDREQHMVGLGPAICCGGRVFGMLEIRIVEIDVGIAVAARSEIDQPAAILDPPADAVDEDETAEMVGP